MDDLPRNMTNRRRAGKHLWHDESACLHAVRTGRLRRVAAAAIVSGPHGSRRRSRPSSPWGSTISPQIPPSSSGARSRRASRRTGYAETAW